MLITPTIEALHALAASIYGDRDAAGALYRGPAHAFSQQDGHHVLSLALPFARREELTLEQEDGGLVVRLGERRRFIPLPSRSLETRSSSFDGQTLTVVFE